MPSSDSRISGAGSSIAFNQTSGGSFHQFWRRTAGILDSLAPGAQRQTMSRSRDRCVHSVRFVVNRMLSLVLSQLYAAFGFGIGSAVANLVRPFFLLALATPNYLYLPGKEQGRKKLASAAFANIGSAGRTRTYNPSVNSRMLCH